MGYFLLSAPQFGKLPEGKRLERILKSPNYKNGEFQNLSLTPTMSPDGSMLKLLYRMYIKPEKDRNPKVKFDFRKTDLNSLNPKENLLIWMGHSSYYLQLDGKKILVDPVFTGNAAPFSFMVKAFEGSDLYSSQDIPNLDYLIITHDHWDHLDYATVKNLFPKLEKVITGLGTGAHLEYWGLEEEKIIELDWGESQQLENGFTVYGETARHFSGRGLKRNQSLWMSFVLESPNKKVYIGGDSGYGAHFKEIGRKHDSIDLAILENGQYNEHWKNIHFLPGENLQALEDLNAKAMLPVHYGKFALALHPWQEPIRELMKFKKPNQTVYTPMPGTVLYWDQNQAAPLEPWWETVK